MSDDLDEAKQQFSANNMLSYRTMTNNQSPEQSDEPAPFDPALHQAAEDFKHFHQATHFPTYYGPIQALGLPVDGARAWTHILIEELTYSPEASVSERLRVARCGVFKVKDVLADINTIMDTPQGWAEAYTKRFMHACQTPGIRAHMLPLLTLIYCKETNQMNLGGCRWFLS